MPEFQNDAWGQEEAYQAALKHYGIKQGRMPDVTETAQKTSAIRSSVRLTEGTGMPVQKRKAVPNGQKPPAVPSRSPFPAVQTVAARKPVVISNPVSGIQLPRTQSPEGGLRKIYRTQDGRFDPSTIQAGHSGLAAEYVRPSSPIPVPSRPTSRSFNRPEVKRTNSNASTSSWRARRDSVTRLARRMSDTFKDMVDIVKMDRHERRDFVRTKHDEAETRRSRDSESPSESQSDSLPHDSKSSYGLSERYSEPSSQRSDESGLPRKPQPGNLTKGEKLAMGVSKAVDPLKPRGRSATNDSDMSFGLTDLAPPGALQECGECSRPTYEYLINGLCKQCHALEVKVAKGREKSQGKSTSR